MFKTEHEAWQAVLETLEMTGEMPFNYSNHYTGAPYKCIGLCDIVGCLYVDRLIISSTAQRMHQRIRVACRGPKVYGRNWLLAPAYNVAPRVPFLKQFIKNSRR